MPLRRVLIVEEQSGARSAMLRLCRLFGLDATPAATIGEALAELARPPPEFILWDLMLPDGSGAEVLAHVRTAGLPSRVAVATGAADPAMLDGVRALHPERLMFKPVDILALRQWLTS